MLGVRGVTSNPTIFQKAIASGDAYDEDIIDLLGNDLAIEEIFQTLAVKDIQDACDLFRPLYDESNGTDGFVSLEVLPVSPATRRAPWTTLAPSGLPSIART